MVYVGFGFLMTFLRAHSWTSIAFNWITAAWAWLCAGLWIGLWERVWHNHFEHHPIELTIRSMIDADFGAATVLITMGALLGKVNAYQLLFVATVETCFAALNYTLTYTVYGASDIGGSMWIHCFGGLFGLMCSWAYKNPKESEQKLAMSSYHSNVFGFIGTLFLWLYWPSFNGALQVGNNKQRAIINTTYSLVCSSFSGLVMSMVLHKGKMNIEQILNATLAGGVMMGSAADMIVSPFVSMCIGFAAGIVSTAGFHFFEHIIFKYLKLHDTCGVAYLHFIPGLIGGFIGCLVAGATPESKYGADIGSVYPMMGGDYD